MFFKKQKSFKVTHSANAGPKRGLKYLMDYSTAVKYDMGTLGVVQFYRIRALRDIPIHGVKAGDYGGLVESNGILDQYDESWIGDDAKIVEGVCVRGNALVSGNATVTRRERSQSFETMNYISENAKVRGNAYILSCKNIAGDAVIEDNARLEFSEVRGGVAISGKAYVHSSIVSGYSQISGTAKVNNSTVSGTTFILDNVNVLSGSSFSGSNRICGDTKVGPNEAIMNLVINGKTRKPFPMSQTYPKTDDSRLTAEQKQWNAAVDSVLNEIMERENIVKDAKGKFNFRRDPPANKDVLPANYIGLVSAVTKIEEEYNTYAHDIVKLLKYPLMTDPTFKPAGKFLQRLRKAKRAIDAGPDGNLTEQQVDDLESSFLAMEAACFKESLRHLDVKQKKSIETAGNLVAIALNESSSEQERESAAKKALDYMEGIILVPSETIHVFRSKAGLKELTT